MLKNSLRALMFVLFGSLAVYAGAVAPASAYQTGGSGHAHGGGGGAG